MDIISYIQSSKANKMVTNLQKNIGYSEAFKHGEKDLINEEANLNARLQKIESSNFKNALFSSVSKSVEKELQELFNEIVFLDAENLMDINEMEYFKKIPLTDVLKDMHNGRVVGDYLNFYERGIASLNIPFWDLKGGILTGYGLRYKNSYSPSFTFETLTNVKEEEQEEEGVFVYKLDDITKPGEIISEPVQIEEKTATEIDFKIEYEDFEEHPAEVKIFYQATPLEEVETQSENSEDTPKEEKWSPHPIVGASRYRIKVVFQPSEWMENNTVKHQSYEFSFLKTFFGETEKVKVDLEVEGKKIPLEEYVPFSNFDAIEMPTVTLYAEEGTYFKEIYLGFIE